MCVHVCVCIYIYICVCVCVFVCPLCKSMRVHTHAPQGLLSDPNMDPEYLGWLVMVEANKKKYKPPLKMITEHYYQKFRGKGGAQLDDHGQEK